MPDGKHNISYHCPCTAKSRFITYIRIFDTIDTEPIANTALPLVLKTIP